MNHPVAIVSVTNDLTTDQRVHRSCTTLAGIGFNVLLVGRKRPQSLPLEPRQYRCHRMQLLFEKGPLFYAEFNVRLFLFLVSNNFNLLVSNDLDTLPATYLAWKIRKRFRKSSDHQVPDRKLEPIRLLHDCHEYFRGVPELVGRPFVTQIWKWIEDRIFPHLNMITAVNESVAELYKKEYSKEITILRNVPFRSIPDAHGTLPIPGLASNHKIILYQGAVNIGRGLEEAISAMKYLRSNAVLLIAGTGDIFNRLSEFVKEEGVSDRVVFLGQVPFQQLREFTVQATIGLSIEKDMGINYQNCLPNKFLDYIQANVPVLVSPFHEMKKLVEQYDIGELLESHNPQNLANQIDTMLMDDDRLNRYKQNLKIAAEVLCWEREEQGLIDLLKNDIQTQQKP